MGKFKGLFKKKARGLQITNLLSKYGNKCYLCGFELNRKIKNANDPRYITFDHYIPRSKGGSDDLSNLRLAHKYCNQTRGNDLIENIVGE